MSHSKKMMELELHPKTLQARLTHPGGVGVGTGEGGRGGSESGMVKAERR